MVWVLRGMVLRFKGLTIIYELSVKWFNSYKIIEGWRSFFVSYKCWVVSSPTLGGPLCLSFEHKAITRGRSMRTCIPSPGPIWATWLKFVGLEISLDLISGSLSISLSDDDTADNYRKALMDKFMKWSARHRKARAAHLLCCSRSSSGTLKRNFLLLRVLTISFLILSEVSGIVRSRPSVATDEQKMKAWPEKENSQTQVRYKISVHREKLAFPYDLYMKSAQSGSVWSSHGPRCPAAWRWCNEWGHFSLPNKSTIISRVICQDWEEMNWGGRKPGTESKTQQTFLAEKGNARLTLTELYLNFRFWAKNSNLSNF